MRKKEVLRKVLLAFFSLLLFYTTIKFLLGKADIFSTIFMIVCYSLLALILILSIVFKIIKKVINYKSYKIYEEGFYYLKAIHKIRYKLYFTGTSEDIETYSAKIEHFGNVLLDIGEDYVSNHKLSQNQCDSIKEMLKKIKRMQSVVKPD